ncbi:hypothetical protein D5018_14505 [Parashewanella curva]|uniref:Uncharacterized protein n=1 Tax=Parashewanella curva TaxID=2338552 RepID=A0A3L8PY60_9GAMM|nr:hypothetical protein [Parashewanella curva]RLV58982.1 hypothetical protein D5018_14505 [Parashewanella curva]
MTASLLAPNSVTVSIKWGATKNQDEYKLIASDATRVTISQTETCIPVEFKYTPRNNIDSMFLPKNYQLTARVAKGGGLCVGTKDNWHFKYNCTQPVIRAFM